MRLQMTAAGLYAVRRCPDALSNVQILLMRLADGSRDTELLLEHCRGTPPAVAQQALGDLLELGLVAPAAACGERRHRPRRSAAAAKMYLVAVFERLRRPRAAQVLASLHAVHDTAGLLEAIGAAVPCLVAHTSRRYASHVMAELQWLLPEALTDAVDLLMADNLRATGSAASAARGPVQVAARTAH